MTGVGVLECGIHVYELLFCRNTDRSSHQQAGSSLTVNTSIANETENDY